MNEPQVDLSRLALTRSSSDAAAKKPRHPRWVSRYVLPGSILAGFIGLLAAAAGRQLLPATSVTVVPVIVKLGEVRRAGTPLFQAAGWIEPRPTAVRVPALAPGVVEELLVVEGQEVEQGQPIARLIAVDAEIAVEQARASLSLREGELQRAHAELAAAETRLKNPLHLKVQVAEARSLLAKAITEQQKLPFLMKAAQADVEFTRRSLEGKRGAEGAVAGVVVLEAERDHAAAEAELEELQTRGPNLQREIETLQAKVQALEDQLRLLVEERRQREEGRAKVVSATALRDEARLQLRLAELALERTLICAPMDGRVLRLVASPGTRVMGLEETAGQSSSTVVEMYDPARLQVRADVRLEDVPMVTPGAPVEIETASSLHAIRGRVLRPTSTANVQKNTLEVKVEVVDPPPAIRPEMLVTATFLAPEPAVEPDTQHESERMFVPAEVVITGEAGSVLWIVDAQSRALRRPVTVGGPGPDGLVEITEGLNPTDKLIASGTAELSSGEAVIIRGEDQTIGVER